MSITSCQSVHSTVNQEFSISSHTTATGQTYINLKILCLQHQKYCYINQLNLFILPRRNKQHKFICYSLYTLLKLVICILYMQLFLNSAIQLLSFFVLIVFHAFMLLAMSIVLCFMPIKYLYFVLFTPPVLMDNILSSEYLMASSEFEDE